MQRKKSDIEKSQPVLTIITAGHVDHGKTTLLHKLTGVWTDTHSEELKRGITIKLGYADVIFYKCDSCKEQESYSTQKKCPNCSKKTTPILKASFVDAPGHETLMATMLSGASIADAALLLVAANENCPQPQTKEHLMALEIIGIKNIIIIQNKIDLVSKEQVLENYKQIKEFVKGTIAEISPIIPLSAQHSVNIDLLIKTIIETFKVRERDSTKDPIMLIARSFDINRPGTSIDDLSGGVLGGALKQGVLKVGDEIEIKPGQKIEHHGKVEWKSVKSKITALKTGGIEVEEIAPGGSFGLQTSLDPFYVKADSLSGNLLGHVEKLPPVWDSFTLKPDLLDRVVGSKEELKVEKIKKGEFLMLNVNSTATVGIVTELHKDRIKINLKLPVCCSKDDRIVISRNIGNRYRLIGVASILG
ncbi:MAG: translation initiation factor IF-2 subunit gamma [Candidatus Woesearchaeota archaeon]|nr:MAG: translation initiation factor IF-2 subunit gamma [Candidatus Woesearchaeota archaeon]